MFFDLIDTCSLLQKRRSAIVGLPYCWVFSKADCSSKLDSIKTYLVTVLIPWTSEVVDALAKPGAESLSPLAP
jgi:hypothetical protein